VIEDEPGATTEQIDRQAPFGDRVLLVIDGAALQVMPLPGSGILTIGRASKCDVVVDSGSVSRHHANLSLGSDVEIEDVGSSNGTFVDGAKVQPHQAIGLTIGVPFLIGAVTLMVQTRAGSRREPAPQSSLLAALEQSASRIAIGRLSVLIVGETGVGKERFAERVHEMSPRRAASFVRINCSAISEPLLEAELFGSEVTHKAGMLELADGGTAFLSDVDQLPNALQQKLLRAVETRRPVLRSGNGGWSGWIDEFGNVRSNLTNDDGSIFYRGSRVLSVTRDSRLIGQNSFYVAHGDWFVFACAAVLLLRIRSPEVNRPFRCPLIYVVAPLGILVNLALMLFLPIDTWIRLAVWLGIGMVIYFAYSRFHSKLNHGGQTIHEIKTQGIGPTDAPLH